MFEETTNYGDPVAQQVLRSIRNLDPKVYEKISADYTKTLISADLRAIENTLKMGRKLDSAPKKIGSLDSNGTKTGVRALLIKMYSKQTLEGSEEPSIVITIPDGSDAVIPADPEVIKLLRAIFNAGLSFNEQISISHRDVVNEIMRIGMVSGEFRKITKELVIETLQEDPKNYYYTEIVKACKDILEGKDLRDEL